MIDTGKELEDLVYNWPVQSEHGFTGADQILILDHIGKENLNMDKYYNALVGITCSGNAIYHCDILTALRCALEDRDMTLEEWD